MTADIIHFTYSSFMYDEINCSAVISNIQPVSYILSLSIYRKRFVVKCIYYQRNELLRKMIKAVIIRTPRYCHRKTICPVICKYKKISTGF